MLLRRAKSLKPKAKSKIQAAFGGDERRGGSHALQCDRLRNAQTSH
jgi:hypothetical protein